MNKPIIVAEMSGNHLGSLTRAKSIITAAAEAGADAVKIQVFTPEQMVDGMVLQSGPWAGEKALELYRQTHIPRAWLPRLFEHARRSGVELFASVFHPDDVDVLEVFDCPRYKIASFELTDLELIRHAAKTGRPLIISTGMGTAEEISIASFAAYPCHTTLLKCTSAYPATLMDANLRAMQHLKSVARCNEVGLSDHTLGHTAAVVATVLGAAMIEKHFTLSRLDGGADAAFSAEPQEFAALVRACREALESLGTVRFGPLESEVDSLPLRRKSGGKRGGIRHEASPTGT